VGVVTPLPAQFFELIPGRAHLLVDVVYVFTDIRRDGGYEGIVFGL
jgi:hypothetical protein